MQTITMFEYEEIEYGRLGWQPDEPVLELLDQLNAAHNNELIQIGRKALKARQFVGVLRVGDVLLQVLPKIDTSGQPNAGLGTPGYEQAAESAARNFMFLLSYAHDLPLYARERATLQSTRSANWFELLTRLLAQELHTQIKAGLDHNYLRFEEQSAALRGTWLIDKHILSLPHERHRFDMRYDEFLPDTPLNRVFSLVVGQLLFLTRDPVNRRLLSDIDGWLQGISRPNTVGAQLLDAVQFTRLNERYRTAFNLARLYVENLTLNMSSGKRQLFAFMFDMNVLFERFIARFLTQHRMQIMPPMYRESRIAAQAEGQSIYLAERRPDQRRAFQLRPDILITAPYELSDTAPLLIIDTKYKRLDDEHARYGVGEGDFYQMLAYSTRLNCRRVLLLYSESAHSGAINGEFVIPQQPDTHYYVSTINLRQPLDNVEPLIIAFRDLFTRIL